MKFTVLIVDDEPEILDILGNLLSTHGFNILAARDGQEALSIVTNTQRRLDLVITDLKMPKVCGIQLANEIRRIRPDCPIILTTGYLNDLSKLPPGVVVIRKPFELKKIINSVCLLLQSRVEERAC